MRPHVSAQPHSRVAINEHQLSYSDGTIYQTEYEVRGLRPANIKADPELSHNPTNIGAGGGRSGVDAALQQASSDDIDAARYKPTSLAAEAAAAAAARPAATSLPCSDVITDSICINTSNTAVTTDSPSSGVYAKNHQRKPLMLRRSYSNLFVPTRFTQ